MKRLMLLPILAVMILSFCVPAAAEDQAFTLTYVPRSARGTLFYLDVYAARPIAAAVFELRYDPAASEYRSVDIDDGAAAVRGAFDGNVVKIAYCHRESGQGKLFRIAFKALGTGNASFSLDVLQAVNDDLQYMDETGSYTLTVSLNKDDVEAGRSGVSTKSSQPTASYSDFGPDSDPAEGDADRTDNGENAGVFRDLSGGHKKSYLLLGACVTVVAGLLVAIGIAAGRRMTRQTAAKGSDDNDENTEEAESPE